jgi:predicted CXXCH cytochrome family protein
VSHVEQMHQSQCYLRSSGDKKMSCLTCHDPHDYAEPARQPAYYRSKCLDCHTEHGCTEPLESRLKKSKDDNCVQCHMPPLSATDIAHTASTDHRILAPNRHPPSTQKPSGSPPAYPLRPFYPERDRPDDKEYKRDLGIGLVHTLGLRPDMQRTAAQAIPLLDEALRRWPDDVELLQSKANALHAYGHGAEALAAFEKVLALEPERESALVSAARLSYRPRQPDIALAYWRRAVAVNPWAPDYRANLVSLLAAKGDWDEVRVHSQAWMRLDPGSIDARKAWIRGLIKAGKKDEARKEFEVIEALDPNNAGTHRDWFEYQMR